jgi:hypothetical protein
MGSPERLFHPKHLESLSKAERNHLKKELDKHLKASPATRKLIKAHDAENEKLRKKLGPTLKVLKAKARARAK